jgi:ribonuclease BN (tRNA processing enzyme)
MELSSMAISISFLGTGSGSPSAEHFFSSAILHLNERHLLVDVGEPCVHLLKERGDLIREIDAVLITHGHVDHIGGLPALLQGCLLQERAKPLPIYLPEEMIAPLRAWVSALYLTEEGLGFPLSWRAWKHAEKEVMEEDIVITPYLNGHLRQSYRGLPGADATRPCCSYSLEIQQDDFRVLFSGDLAAAGELTPWVAQPTTLLVSELSHFSASQLGEALRGASLKALCLVHLAEEYDLDRSELKMQMERMLPEIQDVFLPEDGERLDF